MNPNQLKPLPEGTKGWKIRRLEILILETLARATQPNTGWEMWQKIQRKNSASGKDVEITMHSLSRRGYLTITGLDDDGDCFYTLKINMELSTKVKGNIRDMVENMADEYWPDMPSKLASTLRFNIEKEVSKQMNILSYYQGSKP